MNKKVFLIGMLLGTLPLGVAAQEVLKPDTIHTELRSDFWKNSATRPTWS